MSQPPVQITPHEIECDLKEEREIEFGDYIGDFLHRFGLWYTSHVFHHKWT